MMMKSKNVTINAYGGIVAAADENSIINVKQYNYNNGLNGNELDNIIEGIMNNLSGLKKEDVDEIVNVVEMAKEELDKPEPEASRLRNCLTLISPMFTIANGIPTLIGNLQKLVDFITPYIR